MIVSGCSKVLKLKFQKSDQEKLTLKQGSTLVTTAQVVSQFIENRKSEPNQSPNDGYKHKEMNHRFENGSKRMRMNH